ncbi:MAG: cytochrome P450 [Lasallia pustulata]|uniref:Cytochrome P450 n=1 Tax=Lasallia pustulata TaxID=136370 RepID=A0A5M8Q2S9_9LECA|nr:MAG: cytochrome P450 [Lasallia pustulata]
MVSWLSNGLLAAAGIATHLGYFNRGEHHLYSTIYLQIFFAVFATAVAFAVHVDGEPLAQAIAKVASSAGFYLGGLYTSLLVYRTVFHPLNKFPGPFGFRVSNLWFSLQLGNGDGHKKLLKLHEKYGDFLRTGSSDLSIANPNAIAVVYGTKSKCTRAAWYDNLYPMVSLQTVRQKNVHSRRRRLWSTAFSDKALRGYETRIMGYQDRLLAQLATIGRQPVNVTKWFNLYSFDIMGDLAFATSFNMLESTEEHFAVKVLDKGLEPVGWMLPTWMFRLLVAIPGLANDFVRFVKYCNQRLDERMKMTVNTPDVMATLLGPWKEKTPTGTGLSDLQGDCQLIIVAGSDTTSATLTHLFYELAKNPDHVLKLREELASHLASGSDLSHQQIKNLDHLNAVINETLRLYPVAPMGLARLTPPEGIEIEETYIPGNMTVSCPQYVIGRSENIYADAKAFVPERWYSKPEMIKDKSAFAPFSTGTYDCIGKQLALLSLRTVIAKLIKDFDVSFAPGDNGEYFAKNTTQHFTWGLAELNLVLTKR